MKSLSKKSLPKGLYFITDRSLSKKGVVEDVKAAISGGAKIVQYREKNLTMKEMVREAKEISKICKKNKVIFIVNDRVDLALAVEADGVHLGQDDIDFFDARKILGKNKIIGISVSSIKEAKRFEKLGADYVSLGPIFATSTKKDAGEPIGIEAIKEAKKKLKIPFTVIGGINFENLRSVIEAGAESVCMISAIICDDIEEKVGKVGRIINEHANRKSKKQ
ncbi:MAG: thiamine phosphate synthase [Candidatus Aenigmatarchaeota archaeon]